MNLRLEVSPRRLVTEQGSDPVFALFDQHPECHYWWLVTDGRMGSHTFGYPIWRFPARGICGHGRYQEYPATRLALLDLMREPAVAYMTWNRGASKQIFSCRGYWILPLLQLGGCRRKESRA